jgi:hypothetical protein
MRDITTIILLYLVWNSEVHQNHPTLVPVLATLYVVGVILRIIISLNE